MVKAAIVVVILFCCEPPLTLQDDNDYYHDSSCENDNAEPITKDCKEIYLKCNQHCRHTRNQTNCKEECLVNSGIGNCETSQPVVDTENINGDVTENGEKLYEGDMLLTDNQVKLLFSRARKAEERLDYRWPNAIIPYVITDRSLKNRPYIMEAIRHWMDHTCLQFNPIEPNSKIPHLIFIEGTGCHSRVGRQVQRFPHGQTITIGPGCLHPGKIAHEIGHAIGFYHEHSRRDRDNYVTIMFDNVKDSHQKNFKIAKNVNSYNITYDVNSLMHYHATEFTKNGKNTIIPINPMKHFEIGQREGLSYLDIKLANIMYNCSAHCPKSHCKNDGFFNAECECVCSIDYDGHDCSHTVTKKAKECHVIITSSTIIKTPNYPASPPKDTTCIWWIKSSKQSKIEISFDEFFIYPRDQRTFMCSSDTLEIRLDNQHQGNMYCGKELQNRSFGSTSKEAVILFQSKLGLGNGFKAKITIK